MIFSNFFESMFFLLNIGLSWDLYKSIKDPFQNAYDRYNKLLIVAPFIAILLTVIYPIVLNTLGFGFLGSESS